MSSATGEAQCRGSFLGLCPNWLTSSATPWFYEGSPSNLYLFWYDRGLDKGTKYTQLAAAIGRDDETQRHTTLAERVAPKRTRKGNNPAS